MGAVASVHRFATGLAIAGPPTQSLSTTPSPRTWPTFAAQLLAAHARLDLATEVGLAIRADRRRLRLSQRAYANRRGMSGAAVARLETRAGELEPRAALLARSRDGSRRFPAHHPTDQVSRPPLWWWYREATWAYAKEPNWYAPRSTGWDEAS